MKTVLPLLSEYFGTFLLTLSILTISNPLIVGLIFSAILYLTAGVSGGSMNPAISVVMFMKNKLGSQELLKYIFVEVAAAVSAFYIFKLIK
jgi:glycerol uptake facilitator-like aquaporin